MTFAKQMVLQKRVNIQTLNYNAARTVLYFQKLFPILVGSVVNFCKKYERVVT